MGSGLVLVANTPSRKDDLTSCLDKIIASGTLPRHEALRLRGRLQFASGQIFGRTAKACLAILTSHAYSPVSNKLSDSAIRALGTHRQLLSSDIPRKISIRASHTWFLFTDASYEFSNGTPHSGLGAVLCDERGGFCRFMSEEASPDLLRAMNPNGKKTIIFECEYFAVWCALDLWKHMIAGQHIVIFIDNNTVRDSLISCQTSDNLAFKMVSCILDFEHKANLLPWYARVPTQSDIADGPSRNDFSAIAALGATRYECDLEEVFKCLESKGGGNSPGT